MPRASQRLLAFQGAYYAATGVWSLLHVKSFQAVTGPKTDVWLVKTVGVLVTAIGAALMLASRKDAPPSAETVALSAASAGGLAAIEGAYVASGTISKVYLLDALVEAAILAGWIRANERETPRALVPSEPLVKLAT